MAQTCEELVAHLKEQRAFLKASSAAYDAGVTAEAKRLATTIRVLAHDTKQSTSLLHQLGIKDQLRYVAKTAGMPPGAAIFVGLEMGFEPTGVTYYPSLDPPTDWLRLDFTTWWEAVILNTLDRGAFSRRALVLSLANDDGGAHVGKLKKPYRELSRQNSMGWQVSIGGEEMPPPGSPVPVGVRQVAHEMVWTLNYELPKLFPKEFPTSK